MDWLTVENKVDRRIKLFVAISGVVSTIVSLLYLLSAVLPLYYFHGYVEGYYSIVDYRLHYMYNQHSVPMPHTDYIKHISLTFTLLSTALLALSLTSLALIKQKPHVASGLAYGVASGLGVLYGLLNGYIYRAIGSDLSRFSYLLGDEITYRTLAGTITFNGARIEKTLICRVVFTSPTLLVLLAIAISTSALATGLAMYNFYKRMHSFKYVETGKPGEQLPKLGSFTAHATIALLSLTLLASVFTYYPATITTAPQPPPATLESPAPAYACTLTRINRSALVYTDFETYPSPSWTTYGGSWNSVSGVIGAKGNVLYGENSNPSLGYAAFYHFVGPVAEYSSLWVATRTRFVGGSKPYYGVAMLSHNRTRAFAVMIYRHSATMGYLQIWSYNVTTTGWTQHVSTSISNYGQTSWYTIVVYYSASGSSINIAAHIYDAGGGYVTNTSATITHINVFTPAYIGVVVYDEIPGRTASAYFDEFIASIEDPRSILLTGLQAGMSAEVWDNFGNPVASGTAIGVNLTLSVVHDVVIGNGTDGRIVVKFPTGAPCVDHRVPVTDAILGGDVYRVEYLATVPVDVVLGANKTSASVSTTLPGAGFPRTATFLRVNTSQTLHARLLLDNISAPTALNMDIWIEGVTKSANITIRNGVPVSTSTSIIQLNIGLNNNITLTGYFTSAGQISILNLRLELCTVPGSMGACVYYPVKLNLSS